MRAAVTVRHHGRTVGFSIPMRGNEAKDHSGLRDRVDVGFSIPMRGNEVLDGVNPYTHGVGFSIPMRGNEVMSCCLRAPAAGSAGSFRSP